MFAAVLNLILGALREWGFGALGLSSLLLLGLAARRQGGAFAAFPLACLATKVRA